MNPIDLHNAHLDAMKAAIDAAKRSQAEDGRAHPKVGAVLLKGGQLLATAFRGELGSGDHAEYTLFEKKLTGVDVSDATLFTTLEPCTARKHYKSCSEWIIEKKVRHVFIGILDPNPRIYAQGFTQLKQHGIRVDFFRADLRDEIRRDNATFIAQYFANPELSGEATFNYSLNDGKYTIGHGAFMFETRWAKASDVNIHVYKDATNVRALRLALGAKSFDDLTGADVYDASSRVHTPNEGEFIVLENENGHFAAVQVVDVRDRTRPPDEYDSLTIAYRINTDGTATFRG